MSILSDVEKLGDERLWMSFAMVALILLPGTSFLFYFERILFLEIDIVRLLLLSMSITMPFFLWNLLTFGLSSHFNLAGKEAAFLSFLVASVLTGIIFYVGLLFAYFFNINLQSTIATIIILEIIFTIWLITRKKEIRK